MEALAKLFVLAVQTVVNWRGAVAAGAKRLVQARPPVNKLPELVEYLVRALKRQWPRWGSRRIAQTLARMAVAASRSTVQRILRRPARRPAVAAGKAKAETLRARRPGHLLMIDFTRVGGFFRSVVVGVVMDAFSRKVLALRVSAGEPDAGFACRLIGQAVREYGRPVWVVSDRGPQFTSKRFSSWLARRRIRRRFGAVGRKGSIALIERFHRAMKEEFARGLFLWRSVASIERDLRAYARWHGGERPHQGLGGRTPDEVHYGKRAMRPRRVTSGKLAIRHMGGHASLPVLRLRKTA